MVPDDMVVVENDEDPHVGHLQSFVLEYWKNMFDTSTSYFYIQFKKKQDSVNLFTPNFNAHRQVYMGYAADFALFH